MREHTVISRSVEGERRVARERLGLRRVKELDVRWRHEIDPRQVGVASAPIETTLSVPAREFWWPIAGVLGREALDVAMRDREAPAHGRTWRGVPGPGRRRTRLGPAVVLDSLGAGRWAVLSGEAKWRWPAPVSSAMGPPWPRSTRSLDGAASSSLTTLWTSTRSCRRPMGRKQVGPGKGGRYRHAWAAHAMRATRAG
jgi:hypothetical protein